MTDHAAHAQDHLARASAIGQRIAAEFDHDEPDRSRINAFNVRKRNHTKDAEVHALLAIAGGLQDVRQAIENGRHHR